MPLPPHIAAGLSNASVPTTNTLANFTSGYPIVGNNPVEIDYAVGAASATQIEKFPTDLPKYHFVIYENDWSNNLSGTLRLRKVFKLPLPHPLTDTYEVDYETNFNLLGAVLGGMGAAVAGGTAAVGSVVGAAAGLTLNVSKIVTMSAPKNRMFQFTWKLSPKNFAEAQTIRRIIQALRRGMTPKRTPAGKMILSFPYIYTMFFVPNTKYLYKFKPSVLTTFAVSYEGGNPNPAFYKSTGGEPQESPVESVVISTSWLELEYWLDDRESQAGTDYKEVNGLPTNDPFDAWNWYNYSTGVTPAPTDPAADPLGTNGNANSRFRVS
jgi:hypothetical protein